MRGILVIEGEGLCSQRRRSHKYDCERGERTDRYEMLRLRFSRNQVDVRRSEDAWHDVPFLYTYRLAP